MAKFLALTELYQTIQQNSSQTKNTLWVCSPNLSAGAHKVFSQQIIKNPPTDTRFIFQLNDTTIKQGKTNPYEIQYIKEHFKNSIIKTLDNQNSNIYIFDNSALITSATLTQTALENNPEIGILVETPEELEKIKTFFNQTLWQKAKSITELQKHKKNWNLTQKNSAKNPKPKKNKSHTTIKDWTEENANTWYIGILNHLTTKNERYIRKQASWPTEFSIVGDVGYNAFKQLKLDDLTYLINLYKKHGKIEIELARVRDKIKVETDDGDLHLAGQIEKKYMLEREQFYELLKNLHINSRLSETILNVEQVKQLTDALSSIKKKRKKKTHKPTQTKTSSKEKRKQKNRVPKQKLTKQHITKARANRPSKKTLAHNLKPS
jgi:hypothetical protein